MPSRGPRNSKSGTDPVRDLVPALLSWFGANARDLPWRRTRDPYGIWVSEIMLQQTQVKTVIPYWDRWMSALPTIQAAAAASPARLHKLWEGLGYYTRVRNLQQAAQQIIAQHDGKFPENFDDILALSGIGRYTAGAIASIAFNQPHPILDGNVIRVLARIFGITANPREKKTNARLWKLAEESVVEAARLSAGSSRRQEALPGLPKLRTSLLTSAATIGVASSYLNQSLMELGALVCTPRSPNCEACPVAKLCIARKKGLQEQLPNLAKRAAATQRRFLAFIVERDGRFLVRQRPAGIVNAHLWEFPNVEVGARVSDPQYSDTGINRKRSKVSLAATALRLTEPRSEDFRIDGAKPHCTIKHSITRYRITLEAWRADFRGPSSSRPKLPGRWLSPAQLHRLAFTSAHKKILASLDTKREAKS